MPKNSDIWNYFTRSDEDYAKCNRCNKRIKCKGGTTSSMKYHAVICNKEKKDNNKLSNTFPNNFPKKSVQEEIVVLACVDNLSFSVIAHSDFIQRKLNEIDPNETVPSSPQGVSAIVKAKYVIAKQDFINNLKGRVQNGEVFNLTIDEFTSIQNIRYININIHGHELNRLLCIEPIFGTFDAENALQMTKKILKEYGLDLKRNVFSLTTDGASNMVSFGNKSGCYHQLCLAHGIHLAISSVLYKKTTKIEQPFIDDSEARNCKLNSLGNIDLPEEDWYSIDQNEEASEISKISGLLESLERDGTEVEISFAYNSVGEVITKMRKVVKLFRKSPKKNDILQNYVFTEKLKRLNLINDCVTRWNSLLRTTERFVFLKSPIHKALFEIESDINITSTDWKFLENLVETLKPFEAVLLALCRMDSDLHQSSKVFDFLNMKMDIINTPLSLELKLALVSKYKQRLNVDLVKTYEFLRSPSSLRKIISSEDYMISRNLIEKTINDIFVKYIKKKSENGKNDNNSSFEQKENKLINSTPRPSLDSEIEQFFEYNSDSDCMVVDNCEFNAGNAMLLFEQKKRRSTELERIYIILSTVKPTSVDAERAFSMAGLFLTKKRSSLSPQTLNMLCFLRSYYNN